MDRKTKISTQLNSYLDLRDQPLTTADNRKRKQTLLGGGKEIIYFSFYCPFTTHKVLSPIKNL